MPTIIWQNAIEFKCIWLNAEWQNASN